MKMFAIMFVATAIVVVQISAAEETDIKDEMFEWGKQCGEEIGISKETMEKIKKMTLSDIDDEAFNKWSACWLQKSGMMDDEQNIQKSLVEEVAGKKSEKIENEEDRKKFIESVDSCYEKVVGITDKLETAGGFIKCVSEVKL